MKLLKEWKIRVIAAIMRWMGLGFVLVLHGLGEDEAEHGGCVLWTEDDSESLSAVLTSAVENNPSVRKIVWDAIVPYLRRYEVDQREFVRQIYDKD